MEKQLNYNKKNPVNIAGFFFDISRYLINIYYIVKYQVQQILDNDHYGIHYLIY